MITIIQATNRTDSNTELISRHIYDLIKSIYEGQVGYISMKDLPPEIIHANPYEVLHIPEVLKIIQDTWMIPAGKFIWICPEYNGSYPGIVKLFIDALSVRNSAETFAFKKSALIGVTKGRSGNIRGLDHLADVLIFMKSVIYPRLLPISRVNDLLDEKGQIIHTPTLQVIDDHIRGFLAF